MTPLKCFIQPISKLCWIYPQIPLECNLSPTSLALLQLPCPSQQQLCPGNTNYWSSCLHPCLSPMVLSCITVTAIFLKLKSNHINVPLKIFNGSCLTQQNVIFSFNRKDDVTEGTGPRSCRALHSTVSKKPYWPSCFSSTMLGTFLSQGCFICSSVCQKYSSRNHRIH